MGIYHTPASGEWGVSWTYDYLGAGVDVSGAAYFGAMRGDNSAILDGKYISFSGGGTLGPVDVALTTSFSAADFEFLGAQIEVGKGTTPVTANMAFGEGGHVCFVNCSEKSPFLAKLKKLVEQLKGVRDTAKTKAEQIKQSAKKKYTKWTKKKKKKKSKKDVQLKSCYGTKIGNSGSGSVC